MIKNPDAHELWVEKYRPNSLDTYIGNESMVEKVKGYIRDGTIPHLLFESSSPGTGKTTIAKIIGNSIDAEVMYLNASDDNNIDTVRTKIKSFASTTTFKSMKIVILDEFDGFSLAGQGALRNMMETYMATCRFILTCNYVDKIIAPIQSRCQLFKVIPPQKKDVARKLLYILENEQIEYNKADILPILDSGFPDIRRCINTLQGQVRNGKLILDKKNLNDSDYTQKVIDLIKSKSATKFNDIRQLIANNGIKEFTPLFKALFDDVESYGAGKEQLIITLIADCSVDCTFVVDKEIVVMKMIGGILQVLK